MPRLVEPHKASAQFFAESFVSALREERVTLTPLAEVHVVFLLARIQVLTYDPDITLSDRFARALQATASMQRSMMRDVGDRALLNCGLWWRRQIRPRRPSQASHHQDLGRRAYAAVGEAPFTELAEQFEPVTGVLHRFSADYTITGPLDLLRLYRLWEETHSRYAARTLAEQGITPVPITQTLPS